jgi:hypothetical protein
MQNLNTNFTTAATTTASGGLFPTTTAQAIGLAAFALSATSFTAVSAIYCTKGISRLASKAFKNYRGTKPVGTQTDDLIEIERGDIPQSRLSSDNHERTNSGSSSRSNVSFNNKISPMKTIN